MSEVTIIADDLTGAADCGIAFVLAGLPTLVVIDERSLPASARIVALDTDTRAAKEDAAVERVDAAARAAYASGARTVYKKVDSTLRGHVGAEVAAVARVAREVSGGRRVRVIAAPAFPATGRTMQRGHVLVGGVPLGETEVWKGSGMSGLAELGAMFDGAGLRTSLVSLEAVRDPALAHTLLDASGDAVICDAIAEEDLAAIARGGAQLDASVIWVGSGGLARHLPRALGLQPEGTAGARQSSPATPVLTLVGSRSRVSHDQATTLCRESGVVCLELDPGTLLASRSSYEAEARQVLRKGEDLVLVVSVRAPVDLTRDKSIAGAFGALAAALAPDAGAMFATGGDIARATLQSMGATGIQLLGEVEPGVPVGLTATARPLPFVTKAGAFGTPNTMAHARAWLRNPRSL